MNSDKFNEPFHCAKEFIESLTPGWFEELSDSPLFVFQDLDDKYVEENHPNQWDIIDKFNSIHYITPFPFLRIQIKLNKEDRDGGLIEHLRLWVVNKNPCELFVFVSWKPTYTASSMLIQFRMIENDLRYQKLFVGGIEKELTPELHSGILLLIKCSFTTFSLFIRESMFSGNFIAKVIPKPRSDSPKHIQWAESQKHYVIVHRKDEMNKVGATPIKHSGKTSEIRMAHTRRAHMRILRSAKFKKKQGQQIFIKSCWVGPQEWRTNGSIYKIVS